MKGLNLQILVQPKIVIPAQAGIQEMRDMLSLSFVFIQLQKFLNASDFLNISWIPACAGMTLIGG